MKAVSKAARTVLCSTVILFILGAPMHFIFDLTGKLPLVGAVVPVNESVWEHLKMVFYPMLIWWIIFYFRNRKSVNFSKEKWAVSTAAAILSAILFIIIFFYSYTGAFGVEFLPLDILSQFLGIGIGQLLGVCIFNHCNPGKFWSYISLGIIVALLVMFVLFTFAPPQVPLFKDRPTGGYGIV